jgi:hypothetical protein
LLYTDFPKDWERYDMTEVIHQPRDMEPDILARAMRESVRRTYAWPVLARKALRTLWTTRSPLATMFAWSSNVNYRNVSLG